MRITKRSHVIKHMLARPLTGYESTIKYGYTRLASFVHYIVTRHNVQVNKESVFDKNTNSHYTKYWIDNNQENIQKLHDYI
jgi:hypothetical protein